MLLHLLQLGCHEAALRALNCCGGPHFNNLMLCGHMLDQSRRLESELRWGLIAGFLRGINWGHHLLMFRLLEGGSVGWLLKRVHLLVNLFAKVVKVCCSVLVSSIWGVLGFLLQLMMLLFESLLVLF